MAEKQLVNTIALITKIVRITASVYEVNKKFNGRSNKKLRVRPVNTTRDEEEYFETCVRHLKEKDDEHFFKVTRMSVANFNLLLTLLNEKMQRFSNRKAIDPETRLAVTIFYLAQGCNIQMLAWTYKLGISTVRKIIFETCDAILEVLHDVYLSAPNVNEFISISDKFYVKTGMPNCLGAIDGKHIRIVCPKKSGSMYYNYKKTFSTVLLAACDSNYVFTYVDAGVLGCQGDGGVLSRSDFGRKLLNETLEVPRSENLPGSSTNFPYYFIGDNAFPLKKNLMRPYPGNHLPPDKDKFNTMLAKVRVHIEKAFGILSNRWRVLHSIRVSPDFADKIILATVLLHNFLMLENDINYFTSDLQNQLEIQGQKGAGLHILPSIQDKVANRSSTTAFEHREILKNFITYNDRK